MQNVFDNLWRFDDKLQDRPGHRHGRADAGQRRDLCGRADLHDPPESRPPSSPTVTRSPPRTCSTRGTAPPTCTGRTRSILSADRRASALCRRRPARRRPRGRRRPSRQNIENQLAAGNSAFMMSGLTAPDPETVAGQARQSAAAGASPRGPSRATVGAIVDQKVIKAPALIRSTGGRRPPTSSAPARTSSPRTPRKQSMTFSRGAELVGFSEADVDRRSTSTSRTRRHAPTTVDAFFQEQATTSSATVATAGTSRSPTSCAIQATRAEKPDLLDPAQGAHHVGELQRRLPDHRWTVLGESRRLRSACASAFDLAIDKQGAGDHRVPQPRSARRRPAA